MSVGVLTVADDHYFDWFAALVGSMRRSNPDLPLVMVPYSDAAERCARLAEAAGYTVETDAALLAGCDEVADRLLDTPQQRKRLHGTFRRCAAFEGPFDHTLYVDADTVVLAPLDPLFAAVKADGCDAAFTDASAGWVFRRCPRRDELLRAGAVEWGTGVFVVRRSPGAVKDLTLACDELGDDVAMLHRGCMDQAFLNWYLLHRRRRTVSTRRLGVCSGTWVDIPFVRRGARWFVDDPRRRDHGLQGRIVTWAGYRGSVPDMPFAGVWQDSHALGTSLCVRKG